MRSAKKPSVPLVGHGDSVTHRQELELVEHHLAARRHLLVAVDLAGQQHAQGLGRVAAHGVDLAGRGVGAQQYGRCLRRHLDIKRVLHIARRVVGREVELPEVQLIQLDLGALPDLEAHLGEDSLDLAQHLGGQVQVPEGRRVAGHRHVDPVCGQL